MYTYKKGFSVDYPAVIVCTEGVFLCDMGLAMYPGGKVAAGAGAFGPVSGGVASVENAEGQGVVGVLMATTLLTEFL